MRLNRLPLKTILFAVLGLCLNLLTLYAYEEKPYLNDGSIKEQLEYVVDKSTTYQQYNVIRKTWMNKLTKHVNDSISDLKSNLFKTKQLVVESEARYDSLLKQLNKTNEKLDFAIKEKNSLEVLGLQIDKTAYNSITWIIILGLTIGLLVFIFLFKRSNTVTVRTKSDLNELKEEFEGYRKRALRREEKIVRELHDEINKYKAKLSEAKQRS